MENTTTSDNQTCNFYYNLSFGEDPYEFRPTSTIQRVHNSAIRFGKSSNISVLYQDSATNAEKNEYLVGVITSSILICAFILAWFWVIFTCKLLGPQRVGIFSGKQVELHQLEPSSKNNTEGNAAPKDQKEEQEAINLNENDNDDTPEDEQKGFTETLDTMKNENVTNSSRMNLSEVQHNELIKNYRKRLVRTRIVVLFCSLGIIISVSLFLVSGIRNLRHASNNVVSGLDEGQELSLEAIQLLDNLLARQKVANEAIQPFFTDVNSICPNITNAICDNLNNSNTCDFSNVPLSNDAQKSFSELLDDKTGISVDDLLGIRSDAMAVHEELESASNKISSFNWAFIIAAVFAILLLVCDLCITYGIFLVWRAQYAPLRYQCSGKYLAIARHWLIVPIFIVLVVISWIFSMVFVIGSIASADLCYNSPDNTVIDLLQNDIIPLDSTLRDLMIFYVEGCPNVDVAEDLLLKVDTIIAYAEEVSDLIGEFNSDEFNQLLMEDCGANATVIEASAVTLQGTICNIGATLAEIVLFFSCPNWRPLYRLVAYDALCYNGNEGFYYVALTQFLIVVFAMTMVTLRVAFKPGILDDIPFRQITDANAPGSNGEYVSDDSALNNMSTKEPFSSDRQVLESDDGKQVDTLTNAMSNDNPVINDNQNGIELSEATIDQNKTQMNS